MPQPDGRDPSSSRRWPPRCSSRVVSQVRFSVSPLKIADCTYCGGTVRDGLDEAWRIDDKLVVGQGNSSFGE